MRGEYTILILILMIRKELPPRARRIRLMRVVFLQQLGTTSACAENTMERGRASPRSWNYLRVRGEYRHRHPHRWVPRELPPRARRIPCRPPCLYVENGTTSACAENTVAAS